MFVGNSAEIILNDDDKCFLDIRYPSRLDIEADEWINKTADIDAKVAEISLLVLCGIEVIMAIINKAIVIIPMIFIFAMIMEIAIMLLLFAVKNKSEWAHLEVTVVDKLDIERKQVNVGNFKITYKFFPIIGKSTIADYNTKVYIDRKNYNKAKTGDRIVVELKGIMEA